MAADQDVARQREHDRSWPTHSAEALLAARLRALGEARKAHAQGEPAGPYVLRQSLIDLAAAASKAADDLPSPTALGGRVGNRDPLAPDTAV